MRSLKSIFIGFSFIVISLLLLQLLYLFVEVGLNWAGYGAPQDAGWRQPLSYVVWGSAYLAVMFMGGYITGLFAMHSPLVHAAVVGGLISVMLLLLATQNAQLSWPGIVISLLSVVVTVAGAYRSSQGEPATGD